MHDAAVSLSPAALRLTGVFVAGTIPAVLGITDVFGSDDDEDGGSGDEEVLDDGDDELGDLGELDDGGLDGLDDDADGLGGGNDQAPGELENRLEELENEVASLSSSVNTVQNENEAVSQTVEEVEENVRDLLEIYEMVTRGVNPFVDDSAGMASGGGGGGDFGLFQDDGGNDASGGEIDDSIADADADEFFEDDFDQPDTDDVASADEAAVIDDIADSGGGDSLDGPDMGEDGESDAGGDGKSFEELKEEYESGEADWDVDAPDETADDAPADDGGQGVDDTQEPEDEAAAEDRPDVGEEADAEDADSPFDLENDPPTQNGIENPDPDANRQPEPRPDAADQPDEDATESEQEPASPEEEDEGEKEAQEDDPEDEFVFVGDHDRHAVGPDRRGIASGLHLAEFPDGYLAVLTALDWLEFLISQGGDTGTRAALRYYVDLGWISPAVEAELHRLLGGIRASGNGDQPSDQSGLGNYDPEDHRRSLGYVARLAGDGKQAAGLHGLAGAGRMHQPETAALATNPISDGGRANADSAEGDDRGV